MKTATDLKTDSTGRVTVDNARIDRLKQHEQTTVM
jgi:hypothetical protein